MRSRRVAPGRRFAAAVFGAAVAALCAGHSARAQTGPALLVQPFPKEQVLDARAAWTYEDGGHVQGSNEGVRMAFYESAGRVRLFPGNVASPRVGWDFQYIDIRGDASRGDSRVLPPHLTDESVGAAFPIAKVDEWVFGLSLGLGYAGASPFGEAHGWSGKATAIVFKQFSEKDAIVFLLDYDGNRTFLPDVPLPGIEYTRRVSPTLFYVVGLPLTSVTWKPTERLSLEAGWLPVEAFHAAAGYEIAPHLSAFGSLDYHSGAFRVDGLRGNDRLLFQQRRAEIGLRWAPLRKQESMAFTLAGGYAWGQEFSTGFDARKSDEVADISDEPYVRVGFEVKF